MFSRRKTLQAMGLTVAGVFAPLSPPWFAQEPDRFPNPLQMPPLLDGTATDMGKRFELTLQQGMTRFFPETDTPTWGINQSYLGPTLHFRNGDRIDMRVTNTLGEPTTVHWHGMHLPARCDGGPRQVIEDGSTWNPIFDIKQKAGTFWYHSHMLDLSGPQVYQGLAGMVIVEDEESAGLDLPATYGVDDIPLIVQDRNFTDAGAFQYINSYDELVTGIQGDTILVNGTRTPHFVPTTTRLRLRLLNAANGRTFDFAFSDRRPFLQIASDGGLLEQPVALNSLQLAPAERAEIVVDVGDGQPVNLISLPIPSRYPVYTGAMSELVRGMNTRGFDLLALRPNGTLDSTLPVPDRLTTLERLDPSAAVRTRRFVLNMGSGPRSGNDRGPGRGMRNGYGGGYGGGQYGINGRRMNMDFINERVPLNDIEIWEVYNNSVMTHPFHVHDIQFQILDRDGVPPAANESGRKDTVKVGALETVRLLLRFEDYVDEDNPYMYHCHMLEHEDRGMMGMFVVV